MIGALIIVAMSMIGIPPTGGFFGKWYIILGALRGGNYLAVAAVMIATLLTLAYFVRLWVRLFAVRRHCPTHRASTLPLRCASVLPRCPLASSRWVCAAIAL